MTLIPLEEIGIATEGLLFDPTSSDKDEKIAIIAKSILHHGQLHEIGVAEVAASDKADNPDAKFVVIYGRSRLRAKRLINKWVADHESAPEDVRGFLKPQDTIRVLAAERPKNPLPMVVAENFARLNRGPKAAMQMIVRLYNAYRQSGDPDISAVLSTARELRLSEKTVRTYINLQNLLNASPDIQLSFEEAHVSVKELLEFSNRYATADSNTKPQIAEDAAKFARNQKAVGAAAGSTIQSVRPGQKLIKKALEGLEAASNASPDNNYLEGVRDALRWVEGGSCRVISSILK